jgi:hypothetical protein
VDREVLTIDRSRMVRQKFRDAIGLFTACRELPAYVNSNLHMTNHDRLPAPSFPPTSVTFTQTSKLFQFTWKKQANLHPIHPSKFNPSNLDPLAIKSNGTMVTAGTFRRLPTGPILHFPGVP